MLLSENMTICFHLAGHITAAMWYA